MADLFPINRLTVGVTTRLIDVFLAVSGVRIIVNGIEDVPKKSVIFVSNHFTRIETIILPYILYKRLGIAPRSLTARYVFEALPREFMQNLGSVPVNIPDRDSVAVKSLLAGESWIIFPEGEMVKDKSVIKSHRFLINEPDHNVQRPPHTGAAAIALKAQIAAGMMSNFAQRFSLSSIFGFEHLIPFEAHIVPVNITYCPLRFFKTGLSNAIERVVEFIKKKKLPSRYMEELVVEGSFLRRGVEISVTFGTPHGVAPYAAWLTQKRIDSVFKDETVAAFSRAIKAITQDYMSRVYRLVTVNSDHIMARLIYSMMARRRNDNDWEDMKRRVYLAALNIRELTDVVRDETLNKMPHCLIVWGEKILDDFVDMGIRQGLLRREDGRMIINEKQIKWPQAFHDIRLANTIQVLRNEIEPLPDVTGLVDDTLKLTHNQLVERSTQRLIAEDQERYFADYARFCPMKEADDMRAGMPALSFVGKKVGVLLVHGYLDSPEQMRPISEYLNRQGITTYTTRLAGHGTSHEDLAAKGRRDWYYSVRFGYTILSGMVDTVIVCGYGLGGALALLLAARGAPKIAGIIMISTPTYIQGPRFRPIPLLNMINHLIDRIGISKNPARFLTVDPREPAFGYSLNPVHGMYQYRRLIKEILKQARNVRTPLVIIQGHADPDVDDECADEYYRAVSSPIKSIIQIDDAYLSLVSRKDDRLFEDIIAFIDNPLKHAATPKSGRRKRGA